MELWRSFFQDSRNRPADKFGKEASAPKCSACNGEGLGDDGTLCSKCKGERIDSENNSWLGHLEKDLSSSS